MLHDLARGLDLPKNISELLGYYLKEWNLLQGGVSTTTFRHRHKKLSCFSKWNRISVTASMLTVLWLNFVGHILGNKHPSVPAAHGHEMVKSYEAMKIFLVSFKYEEHQWNMCGDLKVLLGLQIGYTKYMCFLCLWDSRANNKHYTQKDWPLRSKSSPGRFNCLY